MKELLKKILDFLKRFWWILIVLFLIIGLVTYIIVSKERDRRVEDEKNAQKISDENAKEADNQNSNRQNGSKMTDDQLAQANLLLTNGIVINDPQNDSAIPKGKGADALGRPDNHKPYSLGWNDLKKVTFNSDDETFYIRYDFYGIIPGEMYKTTNDEIHGLGGGVIFTKFITNSGKTNEGMWQFGVNWIRGTNDDKVALGWTTEYEEIPGEMDVSGIASPGEVDEFGETRYTSNMQGTYAGGIGYDYIIAAYPLSGFDILPGSEINFSIAVETNSKVYHHSSIDPLLYFGSEKSGKTINYKLGTQTYTATIPKF